MQSQSQITVTFDLAEAQDLIEHLKTEIANLRAKARKLGPRYAPYYRSPETDQLNERANAFETLILKLGGEL